MVLILLFSLWNLTFIIHICLKHVRFNRLTYHFQIPPIKILHPLLQTRLRIIILSLLCLIFLLIWLLQIWIGFVCPLLSVWFYPSLDSVWVDLWRFWLGKCFMLVSGTWKLFLHDCGLMLFCRKYLILRFPFATATATQYSCNKENYKPYRSIYILQLQRLS
jgi:hypothetical protein